MLLTQGVSFHQPRRRRNNTISDFLWQIVSLNPLITTSHRGKRLENWWIHQEEGIISVFKKQKHVARSMRTSRRPLWQEGSQRRQMLLCIQLQPVYIFFLYVVFWSFRRESLCMHLKLCKKNFPSMHSCTCVQTTICALCQKSVIFRVFFLPKRVSTFFNCILLLLVLLELACWDF